MRLAYGDPAKFIRNIGCTLPPGVGILGEAFANQPIQRRRRCRLMFADRTRLWRHDGREKARPAGTVEFSFPGGVFVEYGAESENARRRATRKTTPFRPFAILPWYLFAWTPAIFRRESVERPRTGASFKNGSDLGTSQGRCAKTLKSTSGTGPLAARKRFTLRPIEPLSLSHGLHTQPAA